MYVVSANPIPRNVTASPPAILDAIDAQSGLTSAAQQATAINVLHLKCLDAVIAINTGKNVNGAQDIKLNTSYVPVDANSGLIMFIIIRHPCNNPAAASMYINGAKTADIVAITRFTILPFGVSSALFSSKSTNVCTLSKTFPT